jgi:hypothetical protein
MTSSFALGDRVLYEVSRRDHDSFTVLAEVVEVRRSRIVVRFRHWEHGDMVDRSVRPYTLRAAT